jgi:hypothetical protein
VLLACLINHIRNLNFYIMLNIWLHKRLICQVFYKLLQSLFKREKILEAVTSNTSPSITWPCQLQNNAWNHIPGFLL